MERAVLYCKNFTRLNSHRCEKTSILYTLKDLHCIDHIEIIIFQVVLSKTIGKNLEFDSLKYIDWNDIIYTKENIYDSWCRIQIIPVKMRYCTSFTLSVKAIYFTFQHFLSVVTLHSKYYRVSLIELFYIFHGDSCSKYHISVLSQ